MQGVGITLKMVIHIANLTTQKYEKQTELSTKSKKYSQLKGKNIQHNLYTQVYLHLATDNRKTKSLDV